MMLVLRHMLGWDWKVLIHFPFDPYNAINGVGRIKRTRDVFLQLIKKIYIVTLQNTDNITLNNTPMHDTLKPVPTLPIGRQLTRIG